MRLMRNVKGNVLNTKTKITKTRFLAHTGEFKQTMRENRGQFTAIRKMIDENYSGFLNGKKAVDAKKGITISPARTGSHKGNKNLITLKVETPGKNYFVKEEISNPAVLLKKYKRAERFIRLLGGEYNGFKIKLIKPHIIYGKRTDPKGLFRTMIATDFFEEGRVNLVEDYKGKDVRDLRVAIEELGNKFSRIDIHESSHINSFYEESTKTIYLFDV